MKIRSRRLFALGLVLAVAACAGDDDADDTGADTGAAVEGAAHDSMPGMQMSPPRDADHEFLRMMSNHHEGLVQMATAAMDRAESQTARADAHRVHTKQAAERDTMMQMIQQHYQEQHHLMMMPKNQAQADSLSRLSGAEYDRTFYRMTIDHHREGIGMIDQHLSHLTRPEVRQMAEKMKADQQKEIEEFQRKMGG